MQNLTIFTPEIAHTETLEPIYRFDLLMRWRGYAIVPVEYQGKFQAAIVSPFGIEISHHVSSANSPEYIWAEGRSAVDEDIRATIQDCPELIPALQQVGAV